MTSALWINESGGEPEYTAQSLRLSMSGLLTKGVPDRLGARPGVIPNGQDAVSLSGVQVTVHDCNLVLNPALSAQDGPYIAHFTEHTHTLDPGDGSNARIDIVIARVYDDDHDATGQREAVTEYITGTPGVSPEPPAVPFGALLIATIDVPADGTGSPTLDYVAHSTVASGGVLPVRDQSELPASGRYNGMVAWDEDAKNLVVFTGGEWKSVADTSRWEYIVSGDQISSQTTFQIEPGTYDEIRIRLTGRLVFGSGTIMMRVNEDRTADMHQSGWMTWRPDQNQPLESGVFNGGSWTIAKWNSIEGSYASLTLSETDVPSRIPMLGMSRQAGSDSIRRLSFFSGALASDRQLESLTFLPLGDNDTEFSRVRVWIEGHRR